MRRVNRRRLFGLLASAPLVPAIAAPVEATRRTEPYRIMPAGITFVNAIGKEGFRPEFRVNAASIKRMLP